MRFVQLDRPGPMFRSERLLFREVQSVQADTAVAPARWGVADPQSECHPVGVVAGQQASARVRPDARLAPFVRHRERGVEPTTSKSWLLSTMSDGEGRAGIARMLRLGVIRMGYAGHSFGLGVASSV